MKLFFKVFGFIFALLFAWAAFLQNNDGDAFQWYLVYGVAALASLLFALDRLKLLWALLLFGFYLVFSIVNWPETFEGVTIGEGDIVNVERGREALGMCITAGVMLVYALRLRFLRGSKV